jgi:rubrerythrin
VGRRYPHLDKFASHAGRIEWAPSDFEGAVVSPHVLQAIVAASQLERETEIELAKARRAGLLTEWDLATFFPMWIAEEAEHSRALRCIAEQQGAREYSVEVRRNLQERFRHQFATAGAFLSRLFPSNDVLFLGVGAGAEHMTRTLYRRMAQQVEHDGLKRFLFHVAAQEGRHLSFFMDAAVSRSPSSELERTILRRALTRAWKPVGMDRIGSEKWIDIFWPLIDDAQTQEELRRMDQILDSIPLFTGLRLMDRFLESRGSQAIELAIRPGVTHK